MAHIIGEYEVKKYLNKHSYPKKINRCTDFANIATVISKASSIDDMHKNKPLDEEMNVSAEMEPIISVITDENVINTMEFPSAINIKTEDEEQLQSGGNNSLLSDEKLDRSSVDLWPEQMPGMNKFIANNEIPILTPDMEWNKGFTAEDLQQMLEWQKMPPHEFLQEINQLFDEAQELNLKEAKEMTRGKYLNIFQRGEELNKKSKMK